MSLPHATQEQIDQMNKIAAKTYGVTNEPTPAEPESVEAAPEPVADNSETTADTVSTDAVEAAPVKDEVPVPAKKPWYSKEENLSVLRERARKAEEEREELARQLKSYVHKDTPVQPVEDGDFSMAPDELAEGKHIAKLQRKIQKLEEQITSGARINHSMNAEARLRSQYPDFDKVVSQSNIASLSEMYPDIAKTIGESNDLYSKAVTAYTVIKNLGIYADDYKQEKAVAAKNAAKPRPLNSIAPQQGDSPLSHANAFANGLTEDLAKNLRKEMFEAMKNRN